MQPDEADVSPQFRGLAYCFRFDVVWNPRCVGSIREATKGNYNNVASTYGVGTNEHRQECSK